MKSEARRGLVAGLLMMALGLLMTPTSAQADPIFGDIGGSNTYSSG
jgi:hypothetical protein